MKKDESLNVLMLSLDESLLNEGLSAGDSFERHIDYARRVGSFDIVIVGKTFKKSISRENLTVAGVGESCIPARIYEGWKLVNALAGTKKYSLVTSQDPFITGFLGNKVSKKYGIPLNIQLHADFIDNSYWIKESISHAFLNLYAKRLVKRASTLRVVSTDIEKSLLKIGVDKSVIFDIPTGCGIEVKDFGCCDKSALRKELGIPESALVVLFAGRMVPQKSLRDFVDTAYRVLKSDKSIIFILLGDGPEKDKAHSYADKKGISKNLLFKGSVDYADIKKYFSASDIFLLTSVYEGTARVLEEAAASLLPIVTTAVSGARDVIEDRISGYVVPLKAVEEAAEKVLMLSKDAGMRKTMAKRGREIAEQKYDRQKNIDKLIKMWGETACPEKRRKDKTHGIESRGTC